MSQLGPIDLTVLDVASNLVVGATVNIYREGALVNGNVAGVAPLTVTIRHPGKIAVGDTVFIENDNATTYSVTAQTLTTLQLSGFSGTLSLLNGQRIVPSNSQPTIYSDDQGGASVAQPLTTDAFGSIATSGGLTPLWMEGGAYHALAAGAGATARLYQVMIVAGESPAVVYSGERDGATAVAHVEDTRFAMTVAGGKLKSGRNLGVEKYYFDLDGFLSSNNQYEVRNVKAPKFGAKGDGATDDSAAIQAAIDYASGGAVYVPPGSYVIGASLTLRNEIVIIGAGMLNAILYMKDNVDVPVIDTAVQHRIHLRDITFKADKTKHGTTPPLFRAQGIYLSTFQNVLFWNGPGVGAQIGGNSGGTESSSIRMIGTRAWYNASDGLRFVNCADVVVRDGDFEYNGAAGIRFTGPSDHTYADLVLAGNRFEGNAQYSAYLLRAFGSRLIENYFYLAPVVLDEDCSFCSVKKNFFIFSGVRDGGYQNDVSENDGIYRPLSGPIERYFPASIVGDPDMSLRTTTLWTATNATLAMEDNEDTGGVPLKSRIGRGALRIAATGANGEAYHEAVVVAAEDYLIEAFFWPEGGGAARFELRDQANTVLLASANISAYNELDPNTLNKGVRDRRYSTAFRVPAGVTGLRSAFVVPTNGQAVRVSKVDIVPSAALNGGFEGAYAAGVAPAWTGSGTGTPTEESSIVHSGAAAQRIAVTSGNSYKVSETVAIDTNRLYLLRGFVYAVSGQAAAAGIGYGNITNGAVGGRQFIDGAIETGVWTPVSRVFRPDSQTQIQCGIVAPGQDTVAIFDDVSLIPLKDQISEKTAISAIIALSAAASTILLCNPTMGYRLRRIHVIYSTATDANAGVAINVGISGTAAYYGTLTSEINKTIWSVTEILPVKTDMRAGRPVLLNCVGGKAGVGAIQVAIEYE